MKNKMKFLFLILSLGAAYFLISVVHRFLHEELMVDDCLSGKHGSFDYSRMSCDLNENQPFVPYETRHPHDKHTAIVAGVSSAAFLSAFGLVAILDKRRAKPS